MTIMMRDGEKELQVEIVKYQKISRDNKGIKDDWE